MGGPALLSKQCLAGGGRDPPPPSPFPSPSLPSCAPPTHNQPTKQVYNEQIYDLLDEQGVGPLGHRAALRLKEDALGRVFVAGLSEVRCCWLG